MVATTPGATRPRLRAVVLAAGLGTRLRPLTARLPKPLLPVAGRPLVAWTLARLAAAGVEATAINLHHQADAIAAALGERFDAMPLHYSREPEILGTLGALYPLREFVAGADLVLLVNGDSLCEWPFEELIARHLAAGLDADVLATLLVSAVADPASFGGGVAIDAEGRVRSLLPDGTPGERRVFLGAHVFAPALALAAPAAFSDIVRDLYQPRLAAGATISSLVSATAWHDVGTPGRYLDAVLDWDARARASRDPERGGIGAHAVIEPGAALETDVEARRSVVMAGARVGRGSRLDRVVVGPGVEIAARSTLAEVLVTPRSWGVAPGSREEGALVLTPLEASPLAASKVARA